MRDGTAGHPCFPPLSRVDKDLRFGMALCPVHLQGCLRPRKGFAECHSVLLERAPLQGKGVHQSPLYSIPPYHSNSPRAKSAPFPSAQFGREFPRTGGRGTRIPPPSAHEDPDPGIRTAQLHRWVVSPLLHVLGGERLSLRNPLRVFHGGGPSPEHPLGSHSFH